MPDYSKGKIYKIQCDTTGLVYIGSTVQDLCRRISNHVSAYKGGCIRCCASKVVLENDNYRYSLIEEYPCETKEQLCAREQHWIDSTECVNKHRAILTEEDEKEYFRQYRIANRDKKRQYARDRYKQRWEEIRQYAKNYAELNKEKLALYRESRKEIRKLNWKKYYEENKDKLMEKRRTKRSQLALEDSSSSSTILTSSQL